MDSRRQRFSRAGPDESPRLPQGSRSGQPSQEYQHAESRFSPLDLPPSLPNSNRSIPDCSSRGRTTSPCRLQYANIVVSIGDAAVSFDGFSRRQLQDNAPPLNSSGCLRATTTEACPGRIRQRRRSVTGEPCRSQESGPTKRPNWEAKRGIARPVLRVRFRPAAHKRRA